MNYNKKQEVDILIGIYLGVAQSECYKKVIELREELKKEVPTEYVKVINRRIEEYENASKELLTIRFTYPFDGRILK